ncbi:MAG: inosine/xanthosine triphosphatase [Patescibacteria group bacterium]
MKIIVASLNPQKITAVKELITQYPMLANSMVEGVSVPNGISDQPKSLEETITGAINRAKVSIGDGDYSFGIESGLMAVPHTKTGVMDLCVCAIYDGKNIHLGLSSAFEPPKIIAKLIHEKGMNMSDATAEAGLTTNKNVGAAEGLIGILTHGRLDRLTYTKQAITTALIHLENAHLFHE